MWEPTWTPGEIAAIKMAARDTVYGKDGRGPDRGQATWALKNMIKALNMMTFDNDREDWIRLRTAEEVLKLRRKGSKGTRRNPAYPGAIPPCCYTNPITEKGDRLLWLIEKRWPEFRKDKSISAGDFVDWLSMRFTYLENRLTPSGKLLLKMFPGFRDDSNVDGADVITVVNELLYENRAKPRRKASHRRSTRTNPGLGGDPREGVYGTKVKVGRMRGTYSVFSSYSSSDRMKILQHLFPSYTRDDHQKASRLHREAEARYENMWGRAADRASQETFGRKYQFSDYKISGIGRDEYPERYKKILRMAAQRGSAHSIISSAHQYAAQHLRKRK